MRVPLNVRLDPNQRLNDGRQTIAHQFERAIGRNERNRAIIVKSRQPHTLMEFDILELYRLAFAT